jgi:kojibiose phosphorylase
MFGLSNGYVGVRATIEEGAHGEQPGTFFAGVYDTSEAANKNIVNAPNWIPVALRAEETPINPVACEVLEFERHLDMANAVLLRRSRYRDSHGRETTVEAYRFVSLASPHLAGAVLYVRPDNWSGTLGVESWIDASVRNAKEVSEQPLDYEGTDGPQQVRHLDLVDVSELDAGAPAIYVETRTRDAGIHLGIASALTIEMPEGDDGHSALSAFMEPPERPHQRADLTVRKGRWYGLRKYAAFHTTRDTRADAVALSGQVSRSLDDFVRGGMEAALAEHRARASELWAVAGTTISDDPRAERGLRYNTFELLACYSDRDPDVSIGAKALGGEGYRGQVFWDTEAYLLPFYIFTNPAAARSLLMYRYNRLPAARENARKNGLNGAQFPWNSADTGQEDSTEEYVKTVRGDMEVWHPENMLHPNGTIAYGVEQYVRATGDAEFFARYGAELIIETARMWASRAGLNEQAGRYEIHNVVGPDEYHTYVDNNFYTNVLARWNIRRALRAIEELDASDAQRSKALRRSLGLDDAEIARLRDVAGRIYLPVDEATGVAEQFEGYFELENLTIGGYDENSMPVWPEGFDVRTLAGTQLIKQADVVMTMFLLDEEFDDATIRRNYEYYLPRTMHKSTLSAGIYSIVALRLGEEAEAYTSFIRTAEADLVDSQGSTWQGPHIASAGATWQAAHFGFAGLKVDSDGVLNIEPRLPARWSELSTGIVWRGVPLRITVRGGDVSIERMSAGAAVQRTTGESHRVILRVNGDEREVV